jgi:hypothetical protein
MRAGLAIAALLPSALGAQAPAVQRAAVTSHAARRGDSLIVHYAGSLNGAQGVVLERQQGTGPWRTVGDTARPPRNLEELRARIGDRHGYLARLFDAENDRLLWLRLTSDPTAAGIAALLDADIGAALGRRVVNPRADARADATARYRVRVLGPVDRTVAIAVPRTAERLVAAAAPTATHVPTAVTVRWRHPAGSDALAYHVEGRSSVDTTWRRLSERPVAFAPRGGEASSVIALAREGMSWQFAIRPVGAAGKPGPLSPPLRYDAFDRTPPRPVLDPKGALDSANVATLRWSAAPEPDAAGYIVYRSRDGKKKGGRVSAALIPVERLVWRDTTLVEAGAFIYRLSVVDSAGNESAPGNAAPVNVPDRTPPELRGALSVTVLGDSAVRLRWARTSARDLREYVVSRQRGDKAAGDSWARLTRTLHRDSAFTDRGSSGGGIRGARVLTYRVVAIDSAGNTSAALDATVSIPDLRPPTAAAWLRADRTDGRAVISWGVSASPDVARYELRRTPASAASTAGAPTASRDSLIAVIPAGTRSAYDDFAAGPAAQTYTIVARDSAGNASPALRATLAADFGPPLLAPANVIAFASATSAAVRWDPVTGATSYRVERAMRLNGDFTTVGTTSSTSLIDAAGRAGAWYRVRAIDATQRAGVVSPAVEAARR